MMPRSSGLLALLLLSIAACGDQREITPAPVPLTIIGAQLGGDNSVDVVSTNAFSMPSAAMPLTQKINFSVGNSFFRNPWVVAPASTTARDGLGPLFNTNGCQNCHIKDGRGHLPSDSDDNAVSMLVRVSVPGRGEPAHGIVPHPIYGGQIQDFAIPGHKPEAKIGFDFDYSQVTLNGGEIVQLRRPVLKLQNFASTPMADSDLSSVRIAPPMIGLGYLQALSEQQILAQADPDDADGDGISGRANRVWDASSGQRVLGRFGWKAEQPSLRQQNAGAFAGDMGLTSHIVSADDCTLAQTECRAAAHGGTPEVSDKILDAVTFYTANLAVPRARNTDSPDFIAGNQLFHAIGCANCHTPKWHIDTVAEMPWLEQQTIFPFTDMLLHDMGEGLSDRRPVFLAEGNEWRTPPLWGIGLTEIVNNEFGYLHDGRARNLTEAIVWHGGEAESSSAQFQQLAPQQRRQLLAFLRNL